MRCESLLMLLCGALSLGGCRCDKPANKRAPTPSEHHAATRPAPPAKGALLLAMAQFEEHKDPQGELSVKPGPAKLMILRPAAGEWRAEVLEDPESRVFHKAVCLPDQQGRPGILTIGGTRALLKHWRRQGGKWQATTLWSVSFGGKWDRLRDFELGDVDQDGKDELVIGTHDQGVIEVLQPDEPGWPATEIYRSANTFIHEIEIGDTDGDGHAEIVATPSRPNEAGISQSGGVLTLRFDAKKKRFVSQWVAQYDKRHAKEVLVADIEGAGRAAVYVAVEAELKPGEQGSRVVQPLEVRRYTPADGKWQEERVAALEGGVQARVLLAADLDGDHRRELVVTTMKGGIWRLLPPAKAGQPWRKELIDARSSGFEHAAVAADLDGDGRDELYVVADDQDRVSRYTWRDGEFQRQTLHGLPASDLTWNITPCPEL